MAYVVYIIYMHILYDTGHTFDNTTPINSNLSSSLFSLCRHYSVYHYHRCIKHPLTASTNNNNSRYHQQNTSFDHGLVHHDCVTSSITTVFSNAATVTTTMSSTMKKKKMATIINNNKDDEKDGIDIDDSVSIFTTINPLTVRLHSKFMLITISLLSTAPHFIDLFTETRPRPFHHHH